MKLNHPSLDASVDVPDSESKKWVKAGWKPVRSPKPKPAPPVEEPDTK